MTTRQSKSDKPPRPTRASSTIRTLEEQTPPDRQRSTLELASDVLENPVEWLRTSNTQLGNRRPIDLMGTEEEEKVFNLLHAVDQGLF